MSHCHNATALNPHCFFIYFFISTDDSANKKNLKKESFVFFGAASLLEGGTKFGIKKVDRKIKLPP